MEARQNSLKGSGAAAAEGRSVGVHVKVDTGMHRAGVETPENSLLGVVAGLRGLGAGGTFEGVAIYAEWTTDEQDWAVYERYWRNHAG